METKRGDSKETGVGEVAVNEFTNEQPPGQLGKKITTLGAIAIGYVTLATWFAYSAASAVALASGGANVLVYGLLIVGVCNMASALSLCEPCSQFPNAAGQAAWVYHLHGRFLSYVTSWLVLLGFIFLGVAAQTIATQLILAMINLTFPHYTIQPFHVTVGIIIAATFAFVVGSFASKIVSHLNVFALVWNVLGLLAISLTILIQSRGNYNTVEFALVDIVNFSGWNNEFIPWVLGLSQAALATTAFDIATHFSEELPNPSKQVPIAILSSLSISIGVTMAYAFVLVFTLPPVEDLIATTTGFPFAELLKIKTSPAGAIVLLLVPLLAFSMTLVDSAMATSRCIYSLSRQRGFPFSSFFEKINTRFDSPLRAGALVLVCQSLISLIYLGNTAAFNAIISVPTLLLACSYSVVAYVSLVSRSGPVWNPEFKIPRWLAIGSNLLCLLFTLLLTVFLSLPPAYPVTKENMNYTSVILVACSLVGGLTWFKYRNVYQGPLRH